MDKQNEHLDTLTEIRSMMERSTRFISLSGLSGVFAGIFALAGASVAYHKLQNTSGLEMYIDDMSFYLFFVIDALCVLVASLGCGIFFTVRKAKSKGQSIWDSSARRLIINLMIPLAAGGLFCIVLLLHGLFVLVAPVTLLFYGVSLINASKYTLHDIRALGICQIILGLLASVFLGYGIIFWAIGFGILHILYGTIMYYKYER